MTKVEDSFRKAFDGAPFNERPAIRKEIMSVLGIKTRAAFIARCDGNIEHTRREAMAIESVFRNHGIKIVWG